MYKNSTRIRTDVVSIEVPESDGAVVGGSHQEFVFLH